MKWARRLRVIGPLALLAAGAAVVAAYASGPAAPGRDASGPSAPASAAATTAGGPSARVAPDPGATRVIVPGRPGDPARAVSVDEVEAPDGSAYNGVDTWFVRMMIPHHAQAVEMAALAPGRTTHRGVLALADRIRAAQTPEIQALRGWLSSRELPETDPAHAGHDHGAMPGMQTPEAMRRLAAARGAGFDRLFVAMMSAHHQGAIDMAISVLRSGRDQRVESLATGIAAEQSAEINRMRQLLGG